MTKKNSQLQQFERKNRPTNKWRNKKKKNKQQIVRSQFDNIYPFDVNFNMIFCHLFCVEFYKSFDSTNKIFFFLIYFILSIKLHLLITNNVYLFDSHVNCVRFRYLTWSVSSEARLLRLRNNIFIKKKNYEKKILIR